MSSKKKVQTPRPPSQKLSTPRPTKAMIMRDESNKKKIEQNVQRQNECQSIYIPAQKKQGERKKTDNQLKNSPPGLRFDLTKSVGVKPKIVPSPRNKSESKNFSDLDEINKLLASKDKNNHNRDFDVENKQCNQTLDKSVLELSETNEEINNSNEANMNKIKELQLLKQQRIQEAEEKKNNQLEPLMQKKEKLKKLYQKISNITEALGNFNCETNQDIFDYTPKINKFSIEKIDHFIIGRLNRNINLITQNQESDIDIPLNDNKLEICESISISNDLPQVALNGTITKIDKPEVRICAYCKETFSNENAILLYECQHLLHRKCYIEFLSMIGSKDDSLKCPSAECNASVFRLDMDYSFSLQPKRIDLNIS